MDQGHSDEQKEILCLIQDIIVSKVTNVKWWSVKRYTLPGGDAPNIVHTIKTRINHGVSIRRMVNHE